LHFLFIKYQFEFYFLYHQFYLLLTLFLVLVLAFEQFNEAVLPAIMFMMEKSRLDYTARANPIKVVRAVAAMVSYLPH
jgi:hemocyte protein-glutamine gamma-glutamyltransferase